MLNRSHRVTTKLFEEVMKRGRVIHSPLFVVRILRDTALTVTHIAAVAPVKIAKTSVARHKVRRRIYEAARPSVGKLNPGHVIIFFAKQPVSSIKLADLRHAVEGVFVKAGLLR